MPRKLLSAALLALSCPCQGSSADAASPPEPHFIALRYPADRDFVIAEVGGQSITLQELVDHIGERHFPGFAQALLQPEYQRMLHSDLIAPWVRHYADIRAFEFVMRDSGTEFDREELDKVISERLKTEFEAWLQKYVANNRANGNDGELTQEQVNRLLTRYQLNNGLAVEMQGWLDWFEPGEYNREQLREFFNGHARYFGGQVTFAHILVQHRDGGTGILLKPEAYGRAAAKLADIRLRLQSDGSNFEEVARQFSDDTRSIKDGGKLTGVHRFDDRLPATLCRAAWALNDGEISDVVESQYGWHILKRYEFNQNVFVLFTDDAIPAIETVMRRARQEEALFDARNRADVQLKL
ncbi:MAG: peptidylprolyl isomerase [Planctomycetes bacterium]|nr:peptidylprolyl isomerase [Planctomycetota bacterium]